MQFTLKKSEAEILIMALKPSMETANISARARKLLEGNPILGMYLTVQREMLGDFYRKLQEFAGDDEKVTEDELNILSTHLGNDARGIPDLKDAVNDLLLETPPTHPEFKTIESIYNKL
jgi:hypothetical protein